MVCEAGQRNRDGAGSKSNSLCISLLNIIFDNYEPSALEYEPSLISTLIVAWTFVQQLTDDRQEQCPLGHNRNVDANNSVRMLLLDELTRC